MEYKQSAFIRTCNDKLIIKLKELGYTAFNNSFENCCIATSAINKTYCFITEEMFDSKNPHATWNVYHGDTPMRVDCGKNEELFIKTISMMYSAKQTPKSDYLDLIRTLNQFNGTFYELKDKLGGYNEDDNLFDFNFNSLCGTIHCENSDDIKTPYWLGNTFEIYDEDGHLLGTFYVNDIMEEKYNDCIKIVNIVWDTDGEDVDLPTTYDVPRNISKYEIADYLSGKVGFLVEGWEYGE
jgi:hypothetical protein